MVRPLIFILFMVLTGLFAAINWTVFTTPTTLSLWFTNIDAPLGVIMLLLLALALVAFTIWAIAMQGRALFDARRMTKDLAAQRELTDKAEASRFTELRNHMDTRMDKLQRSIEQQGNGLAAQIGELENRMQTGDRPRPPADTYPPALR
ncbi:MAG: LapA family protein [Ideonella sp.]